MTVKQFVGGHSSSHGLNP